MRFTLEDGLFETFARTIYERTTDFIDVTDEICFVEIGMETTVVQRNVEINNVAILLSTMSLIMYLESIHIGNPMTYNFVDGSTNTPWKLSVIQR